MEQHQKGISQSLGPNCVFSISHMNALIPSGGEQALIVAIAEGIVAWSRLKIDNLTPVVSVKMIGGGGELMSGEVDSLRASIEAKGALETNSIPVARATEALALADGMLSVSGRPVDPTDVTAVFYAGTYWDDAPNYICAREYLSSTAGRYDMSATFAGQFMNQAVATTLASAPRC